MKLYKYLPPERIDVLTTLHVRFTQAEDFNDPFEVAPHLDAILPPRAIDALFGQLVSNFGAFSLESVASVLKSAGLTVDDIDELVGSSGAVRRFENLLNSGIPAHELREGIKSFLSQTAATARPTFGTVFQQKFGTRFGIFSLSETPLSLLMWAHYADSHRGYLLEIESDHPTLANAASAGAIARLLPVSYRVDRPAVTAYDPSVLPEHHLDNLVRDVLLTKSAQWSYEREHRMILPLNDFERFPHRIVQERCHLFPVPPEVITGVVIGARATLSTRAAIARALKENVLLSHVTSRQANVSPARFEVILG